MQPFDESPSGTSGRQIAYDARRLRYLECLAKRAYLKSGLFDRWKDREGRRVPPRDPERMGLCEAIAELGLAKLDPGLELVSLDLDKMTDERRNAVQREWLLGDSREDALGRALLVRAQPGRQDEVFGWERAGVDPGSYWAERIHSAHMEFLLETADFGANEILRIMYLLDDTPGHLQDAALAWRDSDHLQRDANFPAAAASALRTSFTNFKYWFDDPFRCNEFAGKAKEIRENKDLNKHEKMEPGQDMTYWSENHRILFATAEYLAGQFWPGEMFISQRNNRKEGPSGPPRPGDMTGAQHVAHARVRVLRWLNERLRLGFAEWNAPGYYVEDIMPLLNLADFAVDKEIRTRAAMVMDLLVFDLAVHTQGGAFAGSSGRAYFEQKNCLWEQPTRDSLEVLFGQQGHFVQSSNAAAFLATSPGYRPPDTLIAIAAAGPQHFTARSRVSIDFGEAHLHDVGTSTPEDMEFWWSRAAYATKQTIIASRRVATEAGLLDTPPFSKVLPLIKKVAEIIDTAEDVGAGILGGIGGAVVGFATGGPVGAVVGGTAGAIAGASVPDFTEVDAADQFSVFTEGSVLSRANIYSHRSGTATLASVQNFRRGQINFQGWPCVAALSKGAMVWTSYPSAGSRISLSLAFGLIEIDEDIFPVSHDGPNWWTGNVVQPRVVQVRGAAITAYQAKSIQETLFGERTHAWFPKHQFDETRGPESARCNHDSARWFFGRRGDGYVALFCALETTWTDNGPWQDNEIRVAGDTNVFITQIGCVEEFGTFEAFMAKVGQARVRISGLHSGAELQCSYDVPFGERLSLHYDQGASYGGEPLQDDEFPRHRSPFARIEWQQDRYAIRYDNRSLVHDVVHGTRTVGGALTELVHDTPLTFFAQNMALLPWPLYKGMDSNAALGRLISVLRERQPDVVGLSEMWSSSDRARVTSELADLYPYTIEGPHEPSVDLGVTDVELMGGGLLLLSRHPIVAHAQTLYRQCSGDDCLTNKGALHAKIRRTGHPCAVDVFLTHTQAAHPTVGGTTAGARTAVRAQIRHLAAFIRGSRDIVTPAILFGDFNVDYFAHRDLYDYLVAELGGGAVDVAPMTSVGGRARPTGTSESDDGVVSSFHGDHPARPVEDPSRFGGTVERLDYLFAFPGLLYSHHPATSAVVIEQWSPGRDISDHYGIQAFIDTTSQVFPSEREIPFLLIRLRRMQCLQTTSGLGDDEVQFTITARTSHGEHAALTAPVVEEVEAGTRHEFDLAPLRLPDPGEELSLVVEGRELDDLSADDSLGRARLVFERDELLAVVERGTALIALPVLRGDGAEYVVEVDLVVGP